LIGLGQTVTWQGRHFGLVLTHETRITQYDRPHHFQDVMLKGAFRSFVHDHFFEQHEDGTRMRDELRFAAPFGPLGLFAEAFVLRRYLSRFLRERNEVIRRAAEGPSAGWQPYLN
jgi:ligand-binding SRPBCC domain-containing protein